MCILCVAQRWTRRVATMLPWLVIPLMALLAISQLLLPPVLRFEITSPRLACVLVLFGTLFWYEVLMPRLALWRARRAARLRERRQAQAFELHKLRRSATRRCRNCFTAYRDQNPPGGRFMCFYCGHVSKRPVLDLPVPPGRSSVINDLIRRNGWACGQNWSVGVNGKWVAAVPQYWVSNGEQSRFVKEKSNPGVVVFARKLLSCFFVSAGWFWRKIFTGSSPGEDDLSDADCKGSSMRGENEGCLHENRGEKAKRKAEEKRQARLEREMLEEEERKQREEVARLVEERRRLRDEKLEAEKEQVKVNDSDGSKDSRKETQVKRGGRRRERDKGSSKSNSDAEEFEKAASRERKDEVEMETNNGRRTPVRTAAWNCKSDSLGSGFGMKTATSKPRCIDTMRGSFLTSSRGQNVGSYSGRNNQGHATPLSKGSKTVLASVDRWSTGRDARFSNQMMGKDRSNGDDRLSKANFDRAVGSEVKPQPTAPTKPWHQLFTHSSAVPPSDAKISGYLDKNAYLEAQSARSTDKKVSSNSPLGNAGNFGAPYSCIYPPLGGYSNSVSHSVPESICKDCGENLVSEEPKLFEDAVSFLGHVSEALDNLPLDLGPGFVTNNRMEIHGNLKESSASAGRSKPSPIESPISRSRAPEEEHTAWGQASVTQKSPDLHTANYNSLSNTHDHGAWQMWDTPLPHDGLGFLGGPSSLCPSMGKTICNQEVYNLPPDPMILPFAMGNHVLPGIQTSWSKPADNYETGRTLGPFDPGLIFNDLRVQSSLFRSPSADQESCFTNLDLLGNISGSEVSYEKPNSFEARHPGEFSSPVCCSKRDCARNGTQDATCMPMPPTSSLAGDLFLTSLDAQPVWSFQKNL